MFMKSNINLYGSRNQNTKKRYNNMTQKRSDIMYVVSAMTKTTV